MLNALWVLLPSILAGFTQTVTGFGGGIVVMLFFSALSQRDRGDQPQLLYDDLDQSGAVLEIPPFYLLEGDAAALRHLSAGERGCHLSFHAGGCGFHESLAGAFSGGGGSVLYLFSEKIHLRINPATTVLCVTLSIGRRFFRNRRSAHGALLYGAVRRRKRRAIWATYRRFSA